MNPDQHEQIMSELNRLDGELKMLAETDGEGRFWKLLQVGTSAVLAICTAVLIPFGVWTVRSIHSLELRQGTTDSWMAQGPRFSAKDAANLKLEIKDEMRTEIDPKLTQVLTVLTELRMDLKTHLAETRQQRP